MLYVILITFYIDVTLTSSFSSLLLHNNMLDLAKHDLGNSNMEVTILNAHRYAIMHLRHLIRILNSVLLLAFRK